MFAGGSREGSAGFLLPLGQICGPAFVPMTVAAGTILSELPERPV
jgi:hypothetical protein